MLKKVSYAEPHKLKVTGDPVPTNLYHTLLEVADPHAGVASIVAVEVFPVTVCPQVTKILFVHKSFAGCAHETELISIKNNRLM
jgi:hypothetical protein